jgi:virulence-associated protein VagC
MQPMDIDSNTEVKITVEGRKMTIEPLTQAERSASFKKSLHKTSSKNAELFRRLAR